MKPKVINSRQITTSLENNNSSKSGKEVSVYKKQEVLRTQKVQELENELKVSMETNHFEKAAICAKKILFFEPENKKIYSALGIIYIKLHDISSAITYLKKSLLLDPSNSEISTKLKMLSFCKGLIQLEENEKLGIEKEFFEEMKSHMDKSHYHYLRAISALVQGNKDLCIKELKIILLYDQNNLEASILLGKIYLNQGRAKEAAHLLWKAHAQNPKHCEIQQYVGIMKLKMSECLKKANENLLKGKLHMGLLFTSKALELYPNHPEALLLRSSVYRKLGRFNESLTDLNLASANKHIDDTSEIVMKYLSATYNELGLHLIKDKNFQEALHYLEEACKCNGNDLAIHLNKGDCYMQMKEISKALEEYLICVQIDRNNQEAAARCAIVYYKFAIVAYNSKDYEECIGHLTTSVSYFQSSPEFYVLRARACLKLGKVSQAYDDCLTALKFNPKHREALEIKKFLS